VPLKIATWNVNGIRARQVQVEEWVAREQPDVLCLQEIKAAPDQIPMTLVEMEGYWCYWHGGKAYSGVGLLVRKARFPDRPSFTHTSFDFETRVVVAHLPALTVASIYVPNGGKDFPAKLKFLEAVDEHARQAHESGQPIVLCGDLNVARTEMDVHPKERKPRAIGQHAAAQHRLAPRLRARERLARSAGHTLPGLPRGGHERSRAGGRRVRVEPFRLASAAVRYPVACL
jgi:exodeoxyribonuclease-3